LRGASAHFKSHRAALPSDWKVLAKGSQSDCEGKGLAKLIAKRLQTDHVPIGEATAIVDPSASAATGSVFEASAERFRIKAQNEVTGSREARDRWKKTQYDTTFTR
jgi:hypothetical protein